VPPIIWGSVPQRNKNFTGRESLLESLRWRIRGEVTAMLPHALQGLGGVGKTQLAVEYAYRHAWDYQVVWWIPADRPVLARSGLAALAPRLGLTGIDAERVDETIRVVLDCLRRGDPFQPWLLIFDNADQPEVIRELMPSGPGDVLVTSRNHRWQSLVDAVEVDVFTRAESLAFLNRRVPGGDELGFDTLAEEMGDLPLALEQAGALQAETGMSVAEYLDLLGREARKLLAENPPSDYPWPVAAAWSLSVAQVREQMPFALELLRRCAFFGPGPIPRDLLQRGQYVLGPPLQEPLSDPILVSRAMRELGRHALARIDNAHKTLQVHRLIQKLLRDELARDEANAVRHEVHQLLAAADPGDPDSLDNWPVYRELLAHSGPSVIAACADSKVRRLVRNITEFLYLSGEFENCLERIDGALAQWQAIVTKDQQRDLLAMRGQKARVLFALGRYAEAGETRKVVLEQARAMLKDPDHEFILDTTNGYGDDLRARGEFAAAMRLDEELLDRYRRVFGADHPNTFMVANNLALDYCLNGQYQWAKKLDERTYQDRLDHYGRDDNPWVLVSLGAIARDMRQGGEYRAAAEIAGRVNQVFDGLTGRRLFPRRHPFVLLQAKDYSVALRKVGRFADALVLAESVYAELKGAFKLDHPDTLGAAINLGNAQRLAGDIGQAAKLIEDTVRRYGEILGADHPFTYGCLLNLAIVRRSMGQLEQANELLERALTGLQWTTGPSHHYTLTCLTNLATTTTELGNAEKARELGEATLEQFRTVLGENHPHTLACAANLALDRRAVGLGSAADELAADTQERYVLTLGADHPDAIDAIHGVRLTFDFEPPPV
jgi:tetratricopeptide (TPR) repeat protein